MKTRWLIVMACLLITACDNSKSKTESEPETTSVSQPATAALAEYEALESEFDTAMKDFRSAYDEASKDEKAELVKSSLPKPADYVDRFMEVASANPGTDAACKSLIWVATRTRTGEAADNAYNTLFEDHLDNEGLKDVCLALSFSTPSAEVETRLQNLIERSPHNSVKAFATYGMARFLSNVESRKKQLAKNPEAAKRFDDTTIEYLNAFELDPKVVESLYVKLASDLGDIRYRPDKKQTLKSIAEGALFEINNLSIGKMAPDIEGEDLDGKSFKLSDYRGKVVVLDFWGDW